MGELCVGNAIITYQEKISTRAKRLRITVEGDKVTVTVPQGVKLHDVERFVEAKKAWIFKHVQNYLASVNKGQETTHREYATGEKFLFMGHEHVLRTISYNDKNTVVKLQNNTIWVYIPDCIERQFWPEIIKEAITFCFKNQAKKIFKNKLDHFARLMGVKYNQLRIKEQKTRWGSCSGKQNINLNWRAILAPNEVIDYLIIHELAHLKFLNHSKEFWNLVAAYMPEYKKCRKWLKDNAASLKV